MVQSDFGPLQYGEGDYIVIPSGTPYRVVPETTDNFTLIIQSRTPVRFPERAGVGHYAPFDYDVIETPDPRTNHRAKTRMGVARAAPRRLHLGVLRLLPPGCCRVERDAYRNERQTCLKERD